MESSPIREACSAFGPSLQFGNQASMKAVEGVKQIGTTDVFKVKMQAVKTISTMSSSNCDESERLSVTISEAQQSVKRSTCQPLSDYEQLSACEPVDNLEDVEIEVESIPDSNTGHKKDLLASPEFREP